MCASVQRHDGALSAVCCLLVCGRMLEGKQGELFFKMHCVCLMVAHLHYMHVGMVRTVSRRTLSRRASTSPG